MNRELLEKYEELSRRAVACKHWRWMAGMAVMRKDDDTLFDKDSGMSFAISEIRVTAAAFEVCEPKDRFVDVSTLLNDKTRSVGSMFTKDLLPNLTDPATMGCLLALVREATGKPHLFCSYRQEGFWGVADPHEFLRDFYTTEAEALVEALEADQ